MAGVTPPVPPTPPTMPTFDGIGQMPDVATPGREAIEGAQQRAEGARQAGAEAAANAGDAGRRMQTEPVHRESTTATDNRTPEAREAERMNPTEQNSPKNLGTTNVSQVQKNVVEGTNLPPAATDTEQSTQQGVDPSLLTPGRHDASSSLFTILPTIVLAGIIVGVLWQKFMGKRKADHAFLEGAGDAGARSSGARDADAAPARQGDGEALLQALRSNARRAGDAENSPLRTTPYADPATIPKTPRKHAPPLTLADRMHALAEATKDVALNTKPAAQRAATPADSYGAPSPTSLRTTGVPTDTRRTTTGTASKGESDAEPPTKRFEVTI